MKIKTLRTSVAAGLIFVLTGFCYTLFSQNTGGPIKMTYKYPADKPINYLFKSTMTQTMDIQGQTMQSDQTSVLGCSVKSAGIADNGIKVEFTVDTLGQTSNSPMGSAGGAVQGIKGKSCVISIGNDGKATDLSGAEALVFSIEGSGETNLSQTIEDFFPRLPAIPVKIGDTWTTSDSTTTKSPAMTMKTIDTTLCKFEGLETQNGLECARISYQHSGTLTMSIQNQGADLKIMGPYTGTSECLFAFKEGYFVRMTSAIKVKGNLEMTAPQAMSFPILIDEKGVNEMK